MKVWAETCPQYFVLSAADMDRPGFEGAKFMCSPAPRDAAATAGLWEAIRRGTLDVVSSDHSGWSLRRPARQARSNGADAPFRDIPNGVPGLAARLPILWSEGVAQGPHHRQRLRAPDRHQPGPAVRPAPSKGSDRPGPTPTWCCGTRRGA